MSRDRGGGGGGGGSALLLGASMRLSELGEGNGLHLASLQSILAAVLLTCFPMPPFQCDPSPQVPRASCQDPRDGQVVG